MNIFEINEKYGVSLPKLKRMQRDGVLICDAGEGHPLAPLMRANLAKRQALSVEQLLCLIERPSVYAELRTRQKDARAQIAALGDYASGKPAPSLLLAFQDAAENDPKSVQAVIDWAKSVLPGSPVPYSYLGVRAAQGVTVESARKNFLMKFPMALRNARKRPEFAGWFETIETKGRKVVNYFNPGLDL